MRITSDMKVWVSKMYLYEFYCTAVMEDLLTSLMQSLKLTSHTIYILDRNSTCMASKWLSCTEHSGNIKHCCTKPMLFQIVPLRNVPLVEVPRLDFLATVLPNSLQGHILICTFAQLTTFAVSFPILIANRFTSYNTSVCKHWC